MKKQLLFLLLCATISFNVCAQSVTITSVISNPIAIGTVLKVDYKYTVAVDSFIYCGINLQNDWTYVSFVVGQGLDLAVAGTDVVGSFNITIPSGTATTASLTGLQNYKINIELKSLPNFTWIAGDYPPTPLNFTSSLGLDNKNFVNEIVVYPNPVDSILNIANGRNLSDAAFRILNVAGQTIYNPSKINNKEIDVSALSSGVYILSVSSKEGNKDIKFIKK